jgi:NAD(P)-dependent dehydrogenase (short-subunit alcohol dehydrogenase family)
MSNAKEFSSRGVTVNAICPGFIESDMTGELSPEYLVSYAVGKYVSITIFFAIYLIVIFISFSYHQYATGKNGGSYPSEATWEGRRSRWNVPIPCT